MLVPDEQGWTATREGRTYELTRPDDDGAVHISVYQRGGSPLEDDEVGQLLEKFIADAGPDAHVTPRVLKESRSQHRAVARFTTMGGDSAVAWLAFAVLWRDRFLLCSCTASSGSSMPDDAERMFATIAQPKKRFFRRR